MRNNIVLIGMPGVGKSTVGVILAKLLGYRFLDSDLVIQEEEGRLLHEIIEDEGVEGFIDIENWVNAHLECHHTVIATGGSVVYGKEAMEHLKETGIVVYLRIPYGPLEERLSDIRQRGVVLKDGQDLKDVYEERIALYEQYADVIIDEEGCSIEETLQKVSAAVRDYKQKEFMKNL